MRSKAWLAASVSLRLARLPRTASSAQRSRRLRSTLAAAPVLLAHANVAENINIFSMGPKLRYPTVSRSMIQRTYQCKQSSREHARCRSFCRKDCTLGSEGLEPQRKSAQSRVKSMCDHFTVCGIASIIVIITNRLALRGNKRLGERRSTETCCCKLGARGQCHGCC